MALSVSDFQEMANWFSTTTPRSLPSISWSTGDIVVLVGAGENGGQTLGTPTVSGLTFNLKASAVSGSVSDPESYVWASDAAASSSSGTIQMTRTGGAGMFGGAALTITGNPTGTTGAAANRTNSAFSQTVSAGSVVVYYFEDWNANTTDQTITTGSGTATERVDNGNTSNYGNYVGQWVGTSAGTFSFGVTSYSGLLVANAIIEVTAPSDSGASAKSFNPIPFMPIVR